MRSGLSPTSSSISRGRARSAVCATLIPCAWTSSGARAAVSKVCVVVPDLLVERQPSPCDRAQGGRRADNDGLERLHGLASSLDRCVACDLEMADHLRPSWCRRSGGRSPARSAPHGRRSRGRTWIVLASLECSGRLTSRTTCPCSHKKRDSPAPYDPVPSMPKAWTGSKDCAEASAERVDCHGGVGELVSIDADDDRLASIARKAR